jgi:hypothetical protein
LQGALFKKLRDVIMGFKSMNTLSECQIEERVGKHEKSDKNNLNYDANGETPKGHGKG